MSRGADDGRYSWTGAAQRLLVVPSERTRRAQAHAEAAETEEGRRCESCVHWRDTEGARPRQVPAGLAYPGVCTHAEGPVRHAAHSLRLACPKFDVLTGRT